MFINVVLPEPEAPVRATISPRSIVSDTPLSTGTSISPRWYVFRMSSSLMSSIVVIPAASPPAVAGGLEVGGLLLLLAAEHLGGERIAAVVAVGRRQGVAGDDD